MSVASGSMPRFTPPRLTPPRFTPPRPTPPRAPLVIGAVLCGLLACMACGPPPFVVKVTFPGEVAIQEGAPVLYEGVKVGEVERVALLQEDPERAALVAVTLGIEDPSVKLRTKDRFHIASFRGVTVVEVEPSHEPSPPLQAGSTVPGVPPLVTRIEEEIGAAIESIGKAAIDAVDQAIEALERSDAERRAVSPGQSPPADDAARADPTPSR